MCCYFINLSHYECIHSLLFQYSLEEYLAHSSDGDYATIPSEYNELPCVFIKEHMCYLDTALYLTEKITWCPCIICKCNGVDISSNKY